MNKRVLVAAAVLLNAASLFAVPRVTFVRLLPATYDLAPAERLAFIYAIGDSEQVNDFVADFIDAASRAGSYRIEHAVENNHHLVADETALQLLLREHPADGYLGVTAFTCHATDRSAEGSERDSAGDRVKRMHHWVDVVCSARIHVMDRGGKKLFPREEVSRSWVDPGHKTGTSGNAASKSSDAMTETTAG